MAIEHCPKDGETRGWHLIEVNTDYNGKIMTYGDVIGCDFGKEEEVNDSKRSVETRS